MLSRISSVELTRPLKDDVIDVDFWVVNESFSIGVLEAETYAPEGPWSPDPRIDHYLAPIRQAKLEAERREQLKRLIEAQRQQNPPWWLRLYKALCAKRIRRVRPT